MGLSYFHFSVAFLVICTSASVIRDIHKHMYIGNMKFVGTINACIVEF